MVSFGFVFPAAAPWTRTCSAPLVNLYIQVNTDLSAASDWIGLSETGGVNDQLFFFSQRMISFFYSGFMSEWMVGPVMIMKFGQIQFSSPISSITQQLLCT